MGNGGTGFARKFDQATRWNHLPESENWRGYPELFLQHSKHGRNCRRPRAPNVGDIARRARHPRPFATDATTQKLTFSGGNRRRRSLGSGRRRQLLWMLLSKPRPVRTPNNMKIIHTSDLAAFLIGCGCLSSRRAVAFNAAEYPTAPARF